METRVLAVAMPGTGDLSQKARAAVTGRALSDLAGRHALLLAVALEDLLGQQADHWRSVHPVMGEAVDALRTVVQSGGKRLRPLLCYLAFVGTSSRDDACVIPACAALELIHTFAILQDDVMDSSALRRGADSLHVAYAETHARKEWRGDAAKFGESASLLVSDLAFVFADEMMREYKGDVRALFDQLRVEVVMGQMLDLVREPGWPPDERMPLLISCHKTAKYTVERPMHLGGMIAGAPDGFLAKASRFAVPLGLAYQFRDDVLGAFGDIEVTGKPVGEDFREGKRTLLWTYAMAAANRGEREILCLCGDGSLSEEDVAKIRGVVVSTGALKRVECDLDRLFGEAQSALDGLPIAPWATDALRELSYEMAYRAS